MHTAKLTLSSLSLTLLVAIAVTAQSPPGPKNPANPATPPAATAKGNGNGDEKAAEDADPAKKLISLTLKNANITVVEKWLGETTGKAIMKHPKVKCKLNIMSSKKLPADQAVRLVYRALALEGYSAIEAGDVIMIVPEKMEAQVSAKLISEGSEMPGGRHTVIRVFDVHHAKLDKLKEKIQPVLSDKAKLEIDEQARKVIVRDFVDNVRFVENLLQQLDVAPEAARTTKVFSLKHKTSDEVADLLTSVFNGGNKRKRNNKPDPTAVTVIADKTSNRIIVTSPSEKIEEIERLIKTLDTEKPADVTVRLIPLKNVDAKDLQSDLTAMYRKITGRTLKERIEITANSRSNSLIVLSSEQNFRSIKTLVDSLDTKEGSDKEMRSFRLKHAEAEDIAKQLEELHDTNSGGGGYYYSWRSRDNNKYGKVKFVANRRQNEVIAIGTPTALDRVENMLKQLDVPIGGENLAPRIYQLNFVAAKDVENVLNALFKKQETRNYWYDEVTTENANVGRLYGKIRIASEPYTNSIVVTTNSVENFDAIERLLNQMDSRQADREATINLPLKYAKAVSVANNVNILFAGAGSPPRRQPRPNNNNQPRNNNNNDNNDGPSGFELDPEENEEIFYPWLGGANNNNNRGGRGRTGQSRPVSDLIGKVRIVPDTRTNSLLITTAPHFFPQLMKVIEDLDKPTAQVLIEAKIIEVTRDNSDRIGVRWSPDGSQVFDSDDLDDSFLSAGSLGYKEVFTGTLLENALRTGVVEGALNLDLLIQFLQKRTNSRVRAEPRLNVANNERGKLFVGSSIPFIDNSLTTDQGGLNEAFEYRDVGITLEVTPHINQNGEVKLQVRVEASQVRPGVTLFGGAIIDTRNYRSELTVTDGQILVLGGIIQQEESKVVRKIPILGDIPILGYLFSKTDTDERDVELMVFLKPTVTRTPDDVRRLMAAESKIIPMIEEWIPGVSKSAAPGPAEAKNASAPATPSWKVVSW